MVRCRYFFPLQLFRSLKCQDIFFSALTQEEKRGASKEAGKNLSDMRILRAFNSIKIFQKNENLLYVCPYHKCSPLQPHFGASISTLLHLPLLSASAECLENFRFGWWEVYNKRHPSCYFNTFGLSRAGQFYYTYTRNWFLGKISVEIKGCIWSSKSF